MPNVLWGALTGEGEKVAVIQPDGEGDFWVINEDMELFTAPSAELTLTPWKYELKEVDA